MKIKNTLKPILFVAFLFMLLGCQNANNGQYIVEPFSCEVAVADYHELTNSLQVMPKDDFKYPMFQSQLLGVVDSLKNSSCEI